jgi:hypothetical protein
MLQKPQTFLQSMYIYVHLCVYLCVCVCVYTHTLLSSPAFCPASRWYVQKEVEHIVYGISFVLLAGGVFCCCCFAAQCCFIGAKVRLPTVVSILLDSLLTSRLAHSSWKLCAQPSQKYAWHSWKYCVVVRLCGGEMHWLTMKCIGVYYVGTCYVCMYVCIRICVYACVCVLYE